MSETKTFKLNILSFIVAFIIGLIYVYLDSPKERIIIKYPTPYNTNKNVYKGLNDDCYKYKVKEVKCSTEAIPQPII